MNNRILGRTGLAVSELGYGAAPVAYLGRELGTLREVLAYLLDHGVNLIDTAHCYPGSEAALGAVVADRRDDFVLVSKAGHGKDADLPGEDFSAERIAASIDLSLQRMKTDHLDVLLLHSCGLDTLKAGDAVGAGVKAVQQGKVRHAGYSGDNAAAAWAAAQDAVEVIECSVSIADQRNIDEVLPVCVEHDVGVLAKRPIANAAWRQADQREGLYKQYAEDYAARLSAMEVTPRDLGYLGPTEVEWPEIALKFTLAQPGVSSAIAGTTSLTHAESNLAAVEKNPIREQAVTLLRDAFKKAEAEAGQTWRGLTCPVRPRPRPGSVTARRTDHLPAKPGADGKCLPSSTTATTSRRCRPGTGSRCRSSRCCGTT